MCPSSRPIYQTFYPETTETPQHEVTASIPPYLVVTLRASFTKRMVLPMEWYHICHTDFDTFLVLENIGTTVEIRDGPNTSPYTWCLYCPLCRGTSPVILRGRCAAPAATRSASDKRPSSCSRLGGETATMQSLVLALCLGWLSSSLAFPVSPAVSTSESPLQSEPDRGLSAPADELPRSLGQRVLQSERINAKEQTLAGASTDLKRLRRRSDIPPEPHLAVISQLATNLQSAYRVARPVALCMAVR